MVQKEIPAITVMLKSWLLMLALYIVYKFPLCFKTEIQFSKTI